MLFQMIEMSMSQHEHDKIGGKLKHHFKFWISITKDPEALEYVCGLKIPFDSLPPIQTKHPHKITFSESEKKFVYSKLKDSPVTG